MLELKKDQEENAIKDSEEKIMSDVEQNNKTEQGWRWWTVWIILQIRNLNVLGGRIRVKLKCKICLQ